MLATILLLAQLVLPGPPSGPIQPPGMICLGECAGPVVWGPAERGRLVVACNMTSDTCSDGRKITTQRATPVPCEVAPGVWVMVGPNEGCYSVRGLESWAANTSYLAYGASLDQDNWDARSGTTIERVADWWRVSFPQSGSLLTTSSGSIGSAGQSWTAACIAKQGPSGRNSFRMRPFHGPLGVSQYCNDIPLGVEWGLISCTGNTGDAPSASPAVFLDPPNTFIPGDLEVVGCWLPRSDSPGRPCWGGAAPVTCGADRHTISTEGWPTTEGEISWTIRIERLPKSGDPVRGILGVDEPHSHRLGLTGSGGFFLRPADGTDAFSPSLEWEVGRPYSMRLVFTPAGWTLYRDGSVVWSVTRTTAFDWGAVARVGHNLDGSISNLRIRGVR